MIAHEEEIRRNLCDSDQGHVFAYWDELSAEEKKSLIAQLSAIDLDQVNRLIEIHLATPPPAELPSLQPGPVVPVEGNDPGVLHRARERGEQALHEGRVASLVVAGGQATRLGFDLPKGSFPITPVTGKSLFQLHCEKIIALRRRYGSTMPLLVLVSPHNHQATRDYFEQKQYFGLPPEDVILFEQGMLPAVDRDGRLLMASRGQIFLSPDGHGGVFRAMAKANLFEEMAGRGIESVFFFQVDNPLAKIADPVFMGYHLEESAEVSLKVVRKREPAEKVGIYVLEGGAPAVLEYSDTPAEVREAQDESGQLRYWAGNIAIHAFHLSFMEQLGREEKHLPYHMARKKVPCIDETGELSQPSEPNGIKFESYVFDSLAVARKAVAMEVRRHEEFSPVKNRTGEDSPATAVEDQSHLFRSWLRDSGILVEDENAQVEIGPLFALDRDELIRKIREDGLRGARKVLLD